MNKHGPIENRNEPGPRTECLCGRSFETDRGRDVHIGRMNKLSSMVSMVLDRREQILAGKLE